jgi:hypothetical protein
MNENIITNPPTGRLEAYMGTEAFQEAAKVVVARRDLLNFLSIAEDIPGAIDYRDSEGNHVGKDHPDIKERNQIQQQVLAFTNEQFEMIFKREAESEPYSKLDNGQAVAALLLRELLELEEADSDYLKVKLFKNKHIRVAVDKFRSYLEAVRDSIPDMLPSKAAKLDHAVIALICKYSGVVLNTLKEAEEVALANGWESQSSGRKIKRHFNGLRKRRVEAGGNRQKNISLVADIKAAMAALKNNPSAVKIASEELTALELDMEELDKGLSQR